MDEDHIKQYWEMQGKTHGVSHWASWGDNWAIELEIDTISKYIHDNQEVLDVGCANGYAVFNQAKLHNLKSIVGIDFASSMIEAANQAKQQHNLNSNISFFEGDIRSLQFPDNSFDVVYTTRVLINLPTWEQQKCGIMECIRVTKPGGCIVLSEGFWEPLMLLNAIRLLAQLPPLVEHDFNRYLKKSFLDDFLCQHNLCYKIEDFSSVYYLGSRFLRELITDHTKHAGFSNPINKIFFDLEKQFSGGGMGIQQAVVITK